MNIKIPAVARLHHTHESQKRTAREAARSRGQLVAVDAVTDRSTDERTDRPTARLAARPVGPRV